MALWLPATAHCDLEFTEVFPAAECCPAESQGHQPCESGCSTVEDEGLKTEGAQARPEPPEHFSALPELSDQGEHLESNQLNRLEAARAVFQSRDLPQYVIQTALPIRGPSRAS